MSIAGRSLLSLLIALCVAQLIRPAPTQEPPTIDASASVDAAFGAYVDSCEGAVFVPTERIANVVDNAYGWQLRTATDEPVRWREELILPAPPLEWRTLSDVLISDDRTVAVTERVELPVDGRLEHGWSIAPGDPVGPYRLNLYVDGQLVRTFGFTVE